MKFNDFLDSATLHETFVFLAQNQGLSGLDPPKHQKHAKITNFSKITKFSPFSAKLLENLQNDAEISFWRILVVPWPPHAENLNIPIGLLRFLTLPGRPETLQKAKKMKKRNNHEISARIMKLHEVSPNFMKFR